MPRYKVCVYAICKNEEKFVESWLNSMSEADEIAVLDTGSTDRTVELLKKGGAKVQTEKITPWRFDTARNRSLELVSSDMDILVCTDLDERFEPGWRGKIETAWNKNVKRLRYRYTWSFQPDGSEGVVFYADKIHANGLFRWTHPVHEVLAYVGEGDYLTGLASGVQLNHYPDPNKSRSQYFPLLEAAVKEDPDDDRNMHYLGREYMYHEKWEKCIETLKKHLKMPRATWRDERAASMRYIAKSYEMLGNPEEARRWYYYAIGEAPYLREGYMELAYFLYRRDEWEGVAYMTGCAQKIVERPMSYICEPSAWGSAPYDLASIAYFWLGIYDKALQNSNAALEASPNDKRLLKNKDFILKAMQRER